MKILLIDSDKLFLNSMENFISSQLGHITLSCFDVETGLKLMKEFTPDLIISELLMPGLDGFDLLEQLQEPDCSLDAAVIILSHDCDSEIQLKALEKGAAEVLSKPLLLELLALKIKQTLEKVNAFRELNLLNNSFEQELQKRLKGLKAELSSETQSETGLGGIGIYSEAMRQITQLCLRINKDRDLPVLITGETGTGKELLARLIHHGEEGSQEPFITLNCSAIPPTLFESELFGYERGAFTGSNREGKIGKLEMANGGTLFLDEIGDLPLELQPKLLRVIQEREMFRVAGTRSIPLNIRFLFATHSDLQKEVEAKRFRQDLFYRITTVYIKIPPLRERKEEIIPLAQLFLKQISTKKHLPLKFLKTETARLLTQNPWFGNVRELLGAMERAYLITEETEISPDNFPFLLPNAPLNMAETSRRQFFIEFPKEGISLMDLQHRIIAKALLINGNNKTRTARYLGISLNRLKRLLVNSN